MANSLTKYQHDWCDTGSGRQRYVHRWTSASEPRAVVCLVHGLGEHGGRYDGLARQFCQAGYSVLAYDQQGHGRDLRPRGCVDSYDAMISDLDEVLRWAAREFPGLPIALFGHSMGGNIVLNHALRIGGKYRCVISSSPMLRAQRAPGPVGEFLARALMRVRPNFQLKSTVYPERLMSDPAEQDAWRADDLFHTRLSLRLGAALIDSGRWALKNAQRLRDPLLLSHGDDDYLTAPEASQEFARSAGTKCTFQMWPGVLHDPFRCLEKQAVVARFVEYIDEHIELPGEAGL